MSRHDEVLRWEVQAPSARGECSPIVLLLLLSLEKRTVTHFLMSRSKIVHERHCTEGHARIQWVQTTESPVKLLFQAARVYHVQIHEAALFVFLLLLFTVYFIN